MNLTREIAEGVLNEFAPKTPEELGLPREVRALLERTEDHFLRRSLTWTIRLLEVASDRIGWSRHYEISAGSIYLGEWSTPERFRSRPPEIPVFGLVINRQVPLDVPWREPDTYGQIEIEGKVVPIVERRSVVDPHAPAVPGGTTTCWARSTIQPFSAGVLTALHVVRGVTQGQPLVVGGRQGAIARFSSPLDAVFVELATALPAGIGAMPTVRYPTPGSLVRFDGAASGVVNATIAEVTLSHLSLAPWIPQRVILDRAGQRGDSGSLVECTATGSGVAMYTGSLPIGSVAPLGACQLLAQTCAVLNVDLFH